MKKIICSLFFAVFFTVQGQTQMVLSCQNKLTKFIEAKEQDRLSDYKSMVDLFSDVSMNYKKLLKAIHRDKKACKKLFAKKALDCQQIKDQLDYFYDYVHRHKLCCKAIQLHTKIRMKYELAFDDPMIVQAIETNPHLYGLEKYKYKSRAYFNKITNDLRKIDAFEDTIHADFGLLKAHNYVLKIELIKIRNLIYHNHLYKFQTRYF